MQKIKISKYAKHIKLICVIFLMLVGGVLYSCNYSSSKDDLQFTALEPAKEDQTVTLPVNESSDSVSQSSDKKNNILVYVCGEVRNPGVYELPQNARIHEAVALAGGMNENADRNYLNMADYVKDGQKIYIPEQKENLSVASEQQSNGNVQNTLVNINTASKSELMTLPGIGESRAQDILDYRTTVGQFNSIEDIKNVSGIKDAAFKRIKDLIAIK